MKDKVGQDTLKAVAKAQEEYWKIMANPETRRMAEIREKTIRDRVSGLNNAKREGRKEGKIEGKKEGERNKSIEIAKNLKKMNMKIEDIEMVTGITKQEIEKL